MSAADDFTVGPDDHLVLISKTAIAEDELRRMVDRVPERLRGRVLVVDGTTLDAKVIRHRPTVPDPWAPDDGDRLMHAMDAGFQEFPHDE